MLSDICSLERCHRDGWHLFQIVQGAYNKNPQSLPLTIPAPVLVDQHTDGGHPPTDPDSDHAVVEVIASQPVVDHVAEHDAVLRDGEERVHKILAVLVVSPVEVKSKASTDNNALGQHSL